jgi:hypothetical protein
MKVIIELEPSKQCIKDSINKTAAELFLINRINKALEVALDPRDLVRDYAIYKDERTSN